MKINQNLWKALPVGFLMSVAVFQTGCERQDALPRQEISEEALSMHSHSMTNTFYGPAQSLGQGVAKAWVEMRHDGVPVAVGLNISSKAAEHLPEHHTAYNIEFPKQASATLYKNILLDWGPAGHPPVMYQTPHFDMHFYMIDKAARDSIPHEAVHAHSPGFQADYIPANYISTMESIPGMGVHWVDITSPEFTPGGSFTKTYILGAYNDKVIFHEPMITLAYMQSLSPNVTVETTIPQSAKVQESGYYPTKYTIKYDPTPGQYIISLTGFVYRIAS